MNIQIKSRTLLVLILAFSGVLYLIVDLRASVTTDEAHHIEYGERVLHFRPDHNIEVFADSQMPISALNALPGVIAGQFEKHGLSSVAGILNRLKVARIPTIFAALLLELLVYLWASSLYGEAAGLAACLLAALSPNLMAHGSLATTDMYHALGVVGSLYFVRRFLLEPTWKRAFVAGLVLAFAQLTKSFALVLYAVAGAALIFSMFRNDPLQRVSPKRALGFVGIALLCFIAVLNLAYSFDNSFLPLNAYHFETAMFTRLQQTPVLSRVSVPVPYPFLQGLDMMKKSEETGRTFGDVYLLGQLGNPRDPAFHGFKSYYVVTMFFKEPIALQILFVWGLAWVFRNRKLKDIAAGEGMLLLAAAFLFCWMSFFSRAQIGIRHILPVVAIETVIAGAAFYDFSAKSRAAKVILSVLVLWMGISVASYFPQMIPYMNEWVHDRRTAYKLLADSNLDWGQDDAIAKEFVRKNPDVALDPEKPIAGRVLVRANRLTGVYGWDSAAYLQRYQPVAQVGYAHFLFVVPKEDVPGLQGHQEP